MAKNEEKCNSCHLSKVTTICNDCVAPLKKFCKKCFESRHSGNSTQWHTTRDPLTGSIISNHYILPNSGTDLELHSIFIDEQYQLPPDIDKRSMINAILQPQIPNDNNPSYGQPELSADTTNVYKEKPKVEQSNFLQTYSSLSIEEVCTLFEGKEITKFETVDKLASSLKIEDHVDVQIVTFIGKQKDNNHWPNILLLKDNPMQFIKGQSYSNSPLCFMLYDTKNKLLILDTRHMYKDNERSGDSQTILLMLIITLSDVIVFSENTKRTDFIRIHEIMKICKKRYSWYFEKIHKADPQRLAPGVIYLLTTSSPMTESLPTAITNATSRDDLFASFTEIIYFNENSENFCDGLKRMLDNISHHRTRHSLADIWLCINNCEQSLADFKENIASRDIPDCWFLCHTVCEICKKQCINSFNHSDAHYNESECLTNDDNIIYYCKKCLNENNGKLSSELVLKPVSNNEWFWKNLIFYPLRRGIVECNIHGIIYDRNWLITSYENTIFIKYTHNWPGEHLISQNVYPMGQRLIDKVKEISEPVSKIFIQSTEYISDAVKPEDWQSTKGTYNCNCCQEQFTIKMSKHHCRACKTIICSNCCHPNQPSPICKTCFDLNSISSSADDPRGITVANFFRDTLSVSSSFIRKSVSSINRPIYWEDDEKSIRCFNCQREFHNENNPIHHCRACGKCVCDRCSQMKRTVEWRCISDPSRVCDNCIETNRWKKPSRNSRE